MEKQISYQEMRNMDEKRMPFFGSTFCLECKRKIAKKTYHQSVCKNCKSDYIAKNMARRYYTQTDEERKKSKQYAREYQKNYSHKSEGIYSLKDRLEENMMKEINRLAITRRNILQALAQIYQYEFQLHKQTMDALEENGIKFLGEIAKEKKNAEEKTNGKNGL